MATRVTALLEVAFDVERMDEALAMIYRVDGWFTIQLTGVTMEKLMTNGTHMALPGVVRSTKVTSLTLVDVANT